jgi:hypothetical protein
MVRSGGGSIWTLSPAKVTLGNSYTLGDQAEAISSNTALANLSVG